MESFGVLLVVLGLVSVLVVMVVQWRHRNDQGSEE